MKFTIYGEGITVNESTKEEVEKRLSFLNKYFVVDESTSARINTRKYENALKVEVTIPTKIGLLRSEIVHEDLKTGIDLAIDKIEDQIRRNKSRLSRRHKDSLSKLHRSRGNQAFCKHISCLESRIFQRAGHLCGSTRTGHKVYYRRNLSGSKNRRSLQ